MNSSQWLDIAILAIALLAAISGWRSGAPGSLLALVGVVLGAARVSCCRMVSRARAPRPGPSVDGH